jgi:DNA-binding response OmpR family regulator
MLSDNSGLMTISFSENDFPIFNCRTGSMQLSDHRLLITDDDAHFRDAISEALNRRGYRTLLAADGLEALDVLEHGDIHLALFDVHMPRLDGLSVLRSVRNRSPQLPCILMSAKLDDKIIAKANELGAEAILPKPFSLASLMESVRRLLETAYGQG